MANALKKGDAEAVERTRQLFLFNQASVVIAIAFGAAFYILWIDSLWLIVGIIYLTVVLGSVEWAKRSLTIDSLHTVGIFILAVNWLTALVLTALVPFTFPLGILQILSPMIAAGPVLERRGLLQALAAATVLTGGVTMLGLALSETEIQTSIPETAVIAIAGVGVAVMTVPLAIGAWDAHERQQLALGRALEANELIRDSRSRLVRAADDERRRVERNLHDGAQQQLVAVTMQLRLLRSQSDDSDNLDPIISDLEAALEELRDLAHGLYPPLLRIRGLEEALTAAARRSPLPVRLIASDTGRVDPDVEAAIYFCCLEALQNFSKYAGPDASATIELRREQDQILGSIRDTGRGFDADAIDTGAGLRNMDDRIGAVGGDLAIDGSSGTTITFVVPLIAAEKSPPTE